MAILPGIFISGLQTLQVLKPIGSHHTKIPSSINSSTSRL